MARRRGIKAWLQNRIDQTLDNADAKVDSTAELVAELLQEIIDGVGVELTINGKPIRYGLRLIPRGEDDEGGNRGAQNGTETSA